jgi:hypothetical protein
VHSVVAGIAVDRSVLLLLLLLLVVRAANAAAAAAAGAHARSKLRLAGVAGQRAWGERPPLLCSMRICVWCIAKSNMVSESYIAEQ